MVAWSVIPFNDGWVLADINVAILFIFAVSSLEVYGVIMGGWASNSKYPFLGQPALGGADDLLRGLDRPHHHRRDPVDRLDEPRPTSSMPRTAAGCSSWYWIPHFPMVFLFIISAHAETNRPPFDLPEAESELVAGYQVEYSSTPFLLFMIGEYVAIILMTRADLDPVLRRLAVADRGAARRHPLAARSRSRSSGSSSR